MLRNVFDLMNPLSTDLFQKRRERLLVKPCGGFGGKRNGRKILWRIRGHEIPEYARILDLAFIIIYNFHCKEAFVNHLTKPVHHPGAVKIQAGRRPMLQGIETGPFAKMFLRQIQVVPSEGLKKGMSRSDPFEVILLCNLPVSGDTGIFCRQGR